MKKRILVLTDHMPWGHRAIAKAIYGYLKSQADGREYEVYYAEVKSELGIGNDLYTFLYRYIPSGNRVAVKLAESDLSKLLSEDFLVNNLQGLKKAVRRFRPDLIISCYFFHSQSLAKWKEEEEMGYKLWTIVADPWTTNPFSYIPGADLTLVYDQKAKKLAISKGVLEDRVVETGWWVRPEMYQKHDREKSRNKLGFTDNRPVIFVGGGSMGTSSWGRVLPMLLFTKRKVGVVFNTGTDNISRSLVGQYEKIIRKIRRDDLVKIRTLGWIDNMAEVLAGCDLVFGKAGPNFLFDVVACQKPFVSITHLGGQEDGNIELIAKKKLGWVKEKNGQLSRLFWDYLKNPLKYQQKYAASIETEAKNNQKSLERVWQLVKREMA